MWKLNNYCYSLVGLRRVKSKPWILCEKSVPLIKESGAYINRNSQLLPDPETIFLKKIRQSYESVFKDMDISLDKALSALSLITVPPIAKSFVTLEEENEQKLQTTNTLLTERSFYRHSIFLGSSRHVLTPGLQLKGIGRNDLYNRFNYHHSWGGLPFRDVLKSFMCDSVVNKRSPLGAVQTVGALLLTDEHVKHLPLCIALREANFYRVSQISRDFLNIQDRKILKDHLNEKFSTQNPVEILNVISDHYINAALNGINHKSLNSENISIDGRFVDTESIDFLPSGKGCIFNISLELDCSYELETGIRLTDIISKDSEVKLSASWLHNIRYATELTRQCFEIIYEKKIEFDFDHFFKNFTSSLLNHHDWATFLKYESNFESIERTGEIENAPFLLQKNHLDIIGDFKLAGILNLPNGKKELNFIRGDIEESDFSYTINSLKKIEAFIPPIGGDSLTSFENWNKIQKICDYL